MVWARNQQVVPGGSAQNFYASRHLQNPLSPSCFLYLKLLENMLIFTVPSITMDINGEKCILADFLSKVPVVQTQA